MVNFENGSDQNLLLSHYLTTLTFAFYLNAPPLVKHTRLLPCKSVLEAPRPVPILTTKTRRHPEEFYDM